MWGARISRLATAAVAALGLVGGAAGAVTSAHRPAIVAGHHHFVPVTGDWEGTVDGFPASFQLDYEPGYAIYGRHYVQYGFEDVALLEPASCPILPNVSGQEIIGDHTLSPVHGGGSLGLGSYGIHGGLTGARRATLSTVFVVPGCHKKLVWHLHPAQRRPVQDGSWKLSFSDGERGTFTVDGGGRLALNINIPSGLGCAGFGGFGLFIGPRGHAAASGGPGAAITMQFTRRHATGVLGVPPASGQPPCQLSLTASLHKPAP